LYEQDSQGHLTVLTKYKYNTLGKLVKITQVGQGFKPNQVRSFNYDSLGRLISETFPESGTSSFTYDDNGNVLSKRDARGVVVYSTYDALNRRKGTTFSDGTPSAAYVYDETGNDLIGLITNSKGRMTSAWTSDGTGYSWTYDVGGRPTQQTALIDGQMYPLEFSYMDEGCGCRKKDLRKITYPDGFSVNYDKDYAGRVTSVYQDANTVFTRYAYNSPTGGSLTFNGATATISIMNLMTRERFSRIA
jgi:YD repeat-containing protein